MQTFNSIVCKTRQTVSLLRQWSVRLYEGVFVCVRVCVRVRVWVCEGVGVRVCVRVCVCEVCVWVRECV